MKALFNPREPNVGVMTAPMGGGWAWALDAAGSQALFEFFGEEAVEIPVLVGEGAFLRGYIVEPNQAEDLAEHLRSRSICVEVK